MLHLRLTRERSSALWAPRPPRPSSGILSGRGRLSLNALWGAPGLRGSIRAGDERRQGLHSHRSLEVSPDSNALPPLTCWSSIAHLKNGGGLAWLAERRVSSTFGALRPHAPSPTARL